jgi:hypothetical protein
MIELDHHAQSIIHFLNDHELSLCPQTFKIYLAPHLGREEVKCRTYACARPWKRSCFDTNNFLRRNTLEQ